MMNFNAGQVTLRDRGEYGFTYTINYTYSRAMTNSAGNYGAANTSVHNGAWQNAYNSHADYGPSATDVRNNFNALVLYAVPFGRGKRYGAHSNYFEDLVLGGWSLSTSAVLYSGFPISINAPSESNTNSYGQARANQYRPLRIRNRSINNWFGTDPSATPCTGADNGVCAYGPASALSFGTASVGSERVPGYRSVDMSAFKDFHLYGSQSLGFRADAFNVFNIASYGNPDNGVTDGNFGQITNTRSLSRVIQLQLHYTF